MGLLQSVVLQGGPVKDGSALPLTFGSSLISPVSSGLRVHKLITIVRPTEFPPAGCRRQPRRCSPARCRLFLLPFPRWRDGPFEKHVVVFNIGLESNVGVNTGFRGGVGGVAATTCMYGSGSSSDRDGLEDQAPTAYSMGANGSEDEAEKVCREDDIIAKMPPNLDGDTFGFSDTWGDRVSSTYGGTKVDGSKGASDIATRAAAAERKSRVKANGGRVRLKWGIDVDLEVPVILEQLVWGPWDPRDEMWTRQVAMAVQVISRSNGVVFFDQLAPILNPREGPSWSRQLDETAVVRLLVELNGVPEVTNDGDILYVFPDLVRRKKAARTRRDDSAGERSYPLPVEVMQFEEAPGLLASFPRITEEVPRALTSFFQRAALVGFALLMSQCLVLFKLIFGSSPAWLIIGPLYLVWAAVDEILRRSREKAARERDRWRAEWADVCRGDGETVWRKRASARLRARQLARDGM